jgi:hypothetical protein
MNKATTNAIEIALAVYKQPSQFAAPKTGNLPHSMLDVVKSAAGDEATLQKLADELDVSIEQISQACKFYLQKLCASAGDDPFRMLALDSGATEPDIRVHKRWLLKWLHPDRNPSKWEATLFMAVKQAAQQIETGAVPREHKETSHREAGSRSHLRRHSRKNLRPRRKPVGVLSLVKPFLLPMCFVFICMLVIAGLFSNWPLIRLALG